MSDTASTPPSQPDDLVKRFEPARAVCAPRACDRRAGCWVVTGKTGRNGGVAQCAAMSGYVMKPTNHSPRKERLSYREKRVQNIVTHEKPEPPTPPPFRSKIQDQWTLTMCAELPLRLDHWYEPVNR